MTKITFTFDNGPVPGATDRILDILKKRELPAAFFVVGEKVAAAGGRALVERMKREGHQVANHTMHHVRPLGEYEDADDSVREIARAQELLDECAGPERYFRPPGRGKIGRHLLTSTALDYLLANKFTVITWNNVPGDWLEPRRDWFDKAFSLMDENPWNVLVLHDHCQIEMLDLLEAFLDRAQSEDFEICRNYPQSCLPVVNGELRVDRASICNAVTRQ